MKVAIEARALNSNTTAGVKTYATELIRSLREIGGVEYEIIQDNPPAWKLLWWMNVTLPRKLRKIRPDVVHYTKSAMPFDFAQGKPTVVTIHDIIPVFFPGSQAFLQRIFWPGELKRAARQSDHVITVSEASKRDIVEQFQVSPEKITVTPEAVDLQHFKPNSEPGSEPRYILFVGTRDIRKNVPLLIRAFARIAEDIPHQLVIAGRAALKLHDDRKQ
ncbi:MAG: glycosyltransferase, partial [Candidatus Sungbacteria bacterium]|nr:glycosyltransferase [Candidatus Sungbacteria bacterium]